MARNDPAHEETDQLIREMEKKVSREYANAVSDMESKLDKYLKNFEVEDAQKKAEVAAGTLTQEKYLDWRKDQMLISDQWARMKSTLAQDLHNTNRIARSIVNGYMPEAYAANFNYGTFQVEKLAKVDTSFTLYDRHTVERLLRDDPQLLKPPGKKMQETFGKFDAYKAGQPVKLKPKTKSAFDKLIRENRDIRWQAGKLQSVTLQSVLQGESIPHMAKRIADTMGELNKNASIRYARTAMTEAQNAGRVNSYKRAKDMGIGVKQQWMAIHDVHTRHSHRQLDGEIREVGEAFSNGCEYPGDPAGRPEEIWNCRCTLVPYLDKYDFGSDLAYDGKINDMTYEEWKEAHKSSDKKVPKEKEHVVAQGKDITETWKRRPEQFDFEIEDVINAQGFDGLPRVVSKEEFDAAVKAANNGNGFIAQRTYSAPDKETLDAYRDQLYKGKWYVDCSTGGAQYGKGMYCAADYSGKLTDGIQAEMNHYRDLNEGKLKQSAYDSAVSNAIQKGIEAPTKEQFEKTFSGGSYTETMTLDPSAKVITYRELQDMRTGSLDVLEYRNKIIEREINSMELSSDEATFIKYNLGENVSWEEVDSAARSLGNEGRTSAMDKVRMIGNTATSETNAEQQRRNEMAHVYQEKYTDPGSMAAGLGYDAINAEGHGDSGSYTVVLNRTKLIILGE